MRDLRDTISRGLYAALCRDGTLGADRVDDFAQDALVKVLSKIDTFKGDSQFTTWALRVAINASMSTLRKRRWSERPLPKPRFWGKMFRPEGVLQEGEDPERRALQRALIRAVKRTIGRELTSAQKRVFVAVQLEGMPLDEVARRLGTTRGTLYKRMHDARRRIKASLEKQGYSYEDFARIFE